MLKRKQDETEKDGCEGISGQKGGRGRNIKRQAEVIGMG